MSNTVISVEHLTKSYDLGVIGTGTISRDLNRWWARIRKQPDPYTRIGQKDAFERIGETILALDDVSFTVQQGEALGIIGRNGAGKSTLLKILSRVTAPTSGLVKVKGRIGSLLEVGTGFHPELTGRENVYLNGAILGMKKVEVARKFDEIVDFAGVEKFIDTPVKRYSSGMYVRLAFAVAAHLDPEILIVDEVLAVGDAEFQKKCLGKMGDVAGEGRTVLFVSHNMAAIQTLCPEAILLRNGGIYLRGQAEDVISSYLNEATVTVSGFYNIEEHPLRNPRHSPIIKSIKLLQKDGSLGSQFFSGDQVIIELTLDSPKQIRNPQIAIAIEDPMGRRIMTLASFFSKQSIPDIISKSVVRCTIPSLLLGNDNYLLSVSLGTKQEGLLDSVDNAAWFTVNWRDYYGNGTIYHKVYGPVLTNSTWTSVNC